MEQEEYTKEEIDWSYIEFVDNQDILDLIEKVCLLSFFCSLISLFSDTIFYANFTQKPGGIIALLDEAWYDFSDSSFPHL